MVPSAKGAHLPCMEVGQEVLVGYEVGGVSKEMRNVLRAHVGGKVKAIREF